MIPLYLKQWRDELNHSSTLLSIHISINTHDSPVDQKSPPFTVYFAILNYKTMHPPCNRVQGYV